MTFSLHPKPSTPADPATAPAPDPATTPVAGSLAVPASTAASASGTGSRLAGRTAVITGSTSGIGEATARLLAAEGARVVVSGRQESRGRRIVEEIERAGGRADFVPADLSGGYEELRAFAARVTEVLGGRVDILVNNAGVYPATSTEDLPDSDLDTMLAVNIRAPHVLVAALAPAMAERGGGAIVTIGSWMARLGTSYAAMYSATKAADEQLTRSWAAEYGPRGVRVNAVAPGATLTPGNEQARAELDAMTATTPAGVVVRPDDIAKGVLYLAGDDAAMIHGITLYVDGGMTATRAA
ncbi:SDR family NAD(P)-dependent oxidoreductase [Streptomyces sp. NPDC058108]|uniref:SDR family NAD(P)-dependent oxidoreductase n=1 Tax=Streptomyces sp. NPDC058108 TaxID=3346344 RepID=UPI0036E0FCC9